MNVKELAMNSTQKLLFIFLTTLTLGLAAYFYAHGQYYAHGQPKIEDVEINLTAEPTAPGCVRFEGAIINTGEREIEECTVTARISKVRFYDEALRDCEMVSTIAKVKNLKARETRSVVWYFNDYESNLDGIPKGYNNDAPFNYRVDWANGFRWRVGIAEVK
jgi:hypothetical protein